MDKHYENQSICCLQETHLSLKDEHRIRVKGWKTTIQVNGRINKGWDKVQKKKKKGWDNQTYIRPNSNQHKECN